MSTGIITGLTPVILVMNDEYWLPYCLESVRGRFDRYVIYDVGSEDRTPDIIDWFTKTESAEFFVRMLPYVPPSVQGAFRNSMISEAGGHWYLILDADEIYTEKGLDNLKSEFWTLEAKHTYKDRDLLYGIVKRMEMSHDLKQRYNKLRSHHRVYHRTATFEGHHPGEAPVIEQKPDNEMWLDDIICYHFHNTERSTKDSTVPKRIDRRSKHTYHPGDTTEFDLLGEVPLLKNKIENFEVSSQLKELQDAHKV